MTSPEARAAQAVIEQAQSWFTANREGSLSLQQRREFLVWLQASPQHVREYLALAQLAGDLRAATQTVTASPAELIAAARLEQEDNVVTLTRRTSTRHQPPAVSSAQSGPQYRAMLAAALAIVTIGVLSWWAQSKPDHQDYSTRHGEQRTARLDDGSILHLNSDSAVRVELSSTERKVSIARGQALFKVAKDPARPFRVRVGATEVLAVGTEFDVRRRRADVLVTVVEGTVAVAQWADPQTRAALAGMDIPSAVRLTAGQQVRVSSWARSPRAALDVRAVDVRPSIAWVQQQIVFERETLQTVVEEFNRYGAMPMVIEDEVLAQLRISGVFNAYDVESFVSYLEQMQGVSVQRDVDRVRISTLQNNNSGNVGDQI